MWAKRAQAAHEGRVIDSPRLQRLQQAIDQIGILRAGFPKSELSAHERAVRADEQRLEGGQRRLTRLGRYQCGQGLGQCVQVPQCHRALVGVGVAAALVGVVEHPRGLEVVQEPIRPVVQRQAQNGHVVGIHDAVHETLRLPSGDQSGSTFDHLAQQAVMAIRQTTERRKLRVNHEVGQLRHALGLAPVMKELERAEAHVAGCQARQNGGGLDLLAVNGLVAADDGQRAGGRNAQAVHGLAGQVLADGGAQHRPAVGAARERRAAGALELQFVAGAVDIDEITQQQRPAVAQLRHVDAELVTGVHRGQWLHVRRHVVAAQRGDVLRPRITGQAELPAQVRVEGDQTGLRQRGRRLRRVEVGG